VEREYIGDIYSGPLVGGSTAFDNRPFKINPTNALCFPWLSIIASQYDQWEPNGIVFEFVSTSSEYNGASQALGTVIMSTDYDILDAPYTTKQLAENADYACSTKPSQSLLHGIECDPRERPLPIMYTHSESGPSRFQDLGNFQLATVGCSVSDVSLGELWVSYDITFYKKQIVPAVDLIPALSATGLSIVGEGPFSGLTQTLCSRHVALISSGSNSIIQFDSSVQSGTFVMYYYMANWNGEPFTYPTAYVGCTLIDESGVPSPADPDGLFNRYVIFRITTPPPTGAVVNWSGPKLVRGSDWVINLSQVPDTFVVAQY
jgi:hypothetical protein